MTTFLEKTATVPIEQAYPKLRSIIIDNKCKITSEKPPRYIKAKQGSLNGMQPKNAKKIIEFHLSPENSGTRITSSTKIASDWTNLAIFGSLAAAFMTGILLWIAADMQSYVETGKSGFWTWLSQAYGYPDLQNTYFIIDFTRALAVFLIVAIAAEVLIVAYVYPRKDKFAQEILQTMN